MCCFVHCTHGLTLVPNATESVEFLVQIIVKYADALRSQLSSRCNGFHKSIVTQTNTPLGTKLVCDGQKNKSIHVNQDLFNTFLKGNPFSNKSLDTCAVVGNGGILANSSCGEAIDSTQFVIRCNLPPLENDHRKHVGNKTDIVTANPSIFTEK
ncbi:hypothetical protein NL108_004429 [Boleophthalmus pectinirostris]|nr:hypothetical protein NL108_004429 [Boleophthalmus pectinirostris]